MNTSQDEFIKYLIKEIRYYHKWSISDNGVTAWKGEGVKYALQDALIYYKKLNQLK